MKRSCGISKAGSDSRTFRSRTFGRCLRLSRWIAFSLLGLGFHAQAQAAVCWLGYSGNSTKSVGETMTLLLSSSPAYASGIWLGYSQYENGSVQDVSGTHARVT